MMPQPADVEEASRSRGSGREYWSRYALSPRAALQPRLRPLHRPGDAVIISFANSEDVSRVTAITLLAGVEPLLKTSTRGGQSINLGSWNLDLNMNVGVP